VERVILWDCPLGGKGNPLGLPFSSWVDWVGIQVDVWYTGSMEVMCLEDGKRTVRTTEKRVCFVKSILKDIRTGRTLGARLVVDGVEGCYKTSELKNNQNFLIFENAKITYEGFLRSKDVQRYGSIPVEYIEDRAKQVMHVSSSNAGSGLVLLYHENKDKNMKPKYGVGSSNNDYGSGFYLTPNIELGREWSYSNYTQGQSGYLHTYRVDLSGLRVLDLSVMDSNHWVAELLSNRVVDSSSGMTALIRRRARTYIDKYKLDTSSYDVIIGYRADDKYFSYVTDFLNVAITKESLDKALALGNLGIQVFMHSKKAFDVLNSSEHTCEAVPVIYRNKFALRDKKARSDYKKILDEDSGYVNGTTILDLIGGR
jgi:predicted RNase H-like HicB family nuclease